MGFDDTWKTTLVVDQSPPKKLYPHHSAQPPPIFREKMPNSCNKIVVKNLQLAARVGETMNSYWKNSKMMGVGVTMN